MDYDDILEDVGGCGRFQILLCILLGLTTLKTGLDYEMLIYQFYTPEAKCIYPYNSTSSFMPTHEWLSVNNSDVCFYRNDDYSGFSNFSFHNESKIACQKWSFSKQVLQSTLATEFNLMCDSSYMLEWIQSIYFLGCTFGNVFGFFGDKVGRRRMLLFFCAIDIITSTALALTPGLVDQYITRFLRGSAQVIVNQGMLILVEVSSVQHRSILGIIYWSFYSVGYILSAAIAFYFPNWRVMQLIVSLPCLIYFIFPFYVPESPRWLFLRGRKKEAIDVLVTIAKKNNRKVNPAKFEDLDIQAAPSGHWKDLIATKEIFFRLIVVTFLQITCNICYAGLSTDTHMSSENIYLNVLYMGLVEFPSILASWWLCENVGRRGSTLGLFISAGGLIILRPFLPYGTIRTIVAMGSKFFVSTVYFVATVILTEAFPTSIRSLTLYLISMVSWLSTILVPHINSLSANVNYAPASVYSSICVICGIVVFTCLIETKGRPLAQTVFEDKLISIMKNTIPINGHTKHEDEHILLHDTD